MRTSRDDDVVCGHLRTVHLDYLFVDELCFTFYIGNSWLGEKSFHTLHGVD